MGLTGLGALALAPAAVSAAPASISGIVTGAGIGLPDIDVCVYQEFDDDGESFWGCVASAITDEDGRYEVEVEPGTFRVGFEDWLAGEWAATFYGGAVRVEDAADVTVTAGSGRSGIDVAMARQGSVTGAVVDAETDIALDGVEVSAYRLLVEDEEGYWTPVGFTTTDADGNYELSLPPGTYRVGFSYPCERDTPCSTHYVTEYYDDAPSLEEASDVDLLGADDLVGVDAALVALSSISGSVAEAGGEPLPDVEVSAYVWNDGFWDWFESSRTNAAGDYTLHLPAGTYRLGFHGMDNRYQPMYWNQVADIDDADDVVLPPASAVTGRDAVLTSRPSISGTVTDASGEPLTDIRVLAYQDFGDLEAPEWDEVGTAFTGVDGGYALPLPPGAYKLRFVEADGNDLYRGEYYDDAVDLDGAEVVTLGGNDVTGIDAALARLSGDGDLSNSVLPSITGSAQVGQLLSVSPGNWSPTPDSFSYRWLRSGSAVAIGTGPTLTVPAAAVGEVITVEVIAHKAGWADSSPVTSNPSAVVIASPAVDATACTAATAAVSSAQTALSTTVAAVTAASGTVRKSKTLLAKATAALKKAKKSKKAAKVMRAKAKLKKAKTGVRKANSTLVAAQARRDATQSVLTKARASQASACR